jgi:uncharacterized membrane protein
MKRFPLSPDRFFLLVALLVGGALVFVTPPFQVPDEPAHFFRAWDVSEGRLMRWEQTGRGGSELPASVAGLAAVLLGDTPGHPERKVAVSQIRAGLRVPLDPGNRVPVYFPNSVLYTFVPYVPQALVIVAGRAVDASPLVTFYGARLAAFLVSTLLTAFAIRRAPSFRWLLALLALTPMALFQRSSVSADALTIASAFVLGALAARLAWGPEIPDRERRRDFLLLTAAAVALCLCKPAYVLLAAAVLLIPARRLPGGRRAPALLPCGLAVGLAFAAAMANGRLTEVELRPGVGVNAAAQIHDATREPFRFLGVVARDYLVHADRYLAQLVGQLGWLDVKLPLVFLALYLVFLVAFGLLDGEGVRIEPWQRGLLALMVTGTLLLLSAAQYAIWTPYRASYLEGLQGRYYMPVVPVAVWLLHLRPRRIPALAAATEGRLGWAAAGLTAVSAVVTFYSLIERYYG